MCPNSKESRITESWSVRAGSNVCTEGEVKSILDNRNLQEIIIITSHILHCSCSLTPSALQQLLLKGQCWKWQQRRVQSTTLSIQPLQSSCSSSCPCWLAATHPQGTSSSSSSSTHRHSSWFLSVLLSDLSFHFAKTTQNFNAKLLCKD